jgi:hypothetical protein
MRGAGNMIMYEFWKSWYEFTMELFWEVKALRNLRNIDRDRIDRLEKIIYGGYI